MLNGNAADGLIITNLLDQITTTDDDCSIPIVHVIHVVVQNAQWLISLFQKTGYNELKIPCALVE
jgi:hypothetical protein